MEPRSLAAARRRRRCGYCGTPLTLVLTVCEAHRDLPMKDPHTHVFWRGLSNVFPTVREDTTEAPEADGPEPTMSPQRRISE